ncbi:10166_t:CDS:2, partial [Scutellospora calospora]
MLNIQVASSDDELEPYYSTSSNYATSASGYYIDPTSDSDNKTGENILSQNFK